MAKIIERRNDDAFVNLLRDADQEFQEHGFESALAGVLRREPVLISAWAAYSADQRWTPAAYIEGSTAGWYDSGYQHVRTHRDDAGAAADFIRRTAAWVARHEVLMFDPAETSHPADPVTGAAVGRTENPDPDPGAPVVRPGLLLAVKYFFWGSLPDRHRTWVLHDTTRRTWAIREFARVIIVLIPLSAAAILLIPGSLGPKLMTVLTVFGTILLAFFISVWVLNDRRAVRAGYPHNYASELRNRRADDKHHAEVVARRERSAQRRIGR